jgi:hypothetical protein
MAYLISRAAAIEALSTPCDKRYRHGVWETCLDNIETAIRNIPAVDAVPVVRCRDCKWWEEGQTTDGVKGFCPISGCCEGPEFYCADGERRESE